ncbi:MAG: phosphodiesterase, partial [Zetaproteobacteria bacterium]
HVRVSPGNHCDERALFSTLFPRLGIPPLAQDEGLMLGGWRILALNTHDPAASPGGRLGKRELARLEEALADARGKPVLIAMHHPPVPVGTPWLDAMGLEDAEQFWEIAKRHAELRAVVFGHAHQALALERSGVRLFGTPSTCIQFAQGSERITFSVEPIGWRWIRLNDDGTMHTRVRRVAAAPLPMPSDQEPY